MQKQEESTVQVQPSAHARKRKILVVDDSADILELTKIILETAEYETFSACSGREALQVLSEIDPPDLILLDMRMEDMSGPEFLTILEEKKPELVKQVPVVFVTGLEKVPMSRASGFIRKPFQIDQFLSAVHHFIEAGTETGC